MAGAQVVAWPEPKPLLSNGTTEYWVSPESSCHCDNGYPIVLRPKLRNNREREKKVIHIVPRTANYHRFLAFLVSGSYAPVVFMPRLLGRKAIQS